MLIATQISSFLIPRDIWLQGYAGRKDLPPLVVPARDALDIERRQQKGVNLRNERHRYMLCCERIQGIVVELAQESSILPPPMIWPDHRKSDGLCPSAQTYLALIEALAPYQQDTQNGRFTATFFPPDYAQAHLDVFERIRRGAGLDGLFDSKRRASILGGFFKVTVAQYKSALAQRYELLGTVASEGYGLVDVVEL